MSDGRGCRAGGSVPSSPPLLLPQLFPPFPGAEGTPPAQGPCTSAHQEGPCPGWAAPCWGAFEQSPDCLHAVTRDTGPSMRPSELGPWASSQGRPVGEDRPEIVCLSPSLSLSASHFLSSPAVFSALKFAPTIHPSIWLPVSPQLLPHPEVPTWPTGEPRMALSGHQHTWLLWRLRW